MSSKPLPSEPLSTRPITEKQAAILEFIVSTLRDRGFSPTLREIGNRFSVKSTNGVNDHLNALERKGYIYRESGAKSRAIRVLKVLKVPSIEETAKAPVCPTCGTKWGPPAPQGGFDGGSSA